MTDLLLTFLTALVSYLIGGIPFGYLIARSRGVDIFKEGSGNIGATNVARVLGKKFGILAFVLDFAKGAGPVLAAMFFLKNFAQQLSAEELGVTAGLSAVLGHLFPVYLRFKGGKGVATAAGVVVVLLPLAALVGLLVWVGITSATRHVSAGSLAAALTLVAVRLLTTPAPFAAENSILTLFCFVAAALVFVRHRTNIVRLLQGNENRLKEGGLMEKVSKIVHVLALGLWFGMAIFFSFVVGLSLFSEMEKLVQPESRPEWVTVSPQFLVEDDKIKGPYEYGTRIAGYLISPMFDWYFLLQGICGFLAIATAWRWQYSHPEQKVNRRRVTILLVALATVILGWPLERHVSDLRHERHEKMDAFFASSPADREAAKQAALEARSQFGLYHTYSLFLNFATLALLAVGMGMAAFLPQGEKVEVSKPGAGNPPGS